jgi:phosphoribosylformylglycinamidine (FGAM) synthase-like enzyme
VGGPVFHLGQSTWLKVCHDKLAGAPPPTDLDLARRTGELIRAAISAGVVNACHDISDGGPLVAIAEMALVGNLGVDVEGIDWEVKSLRENWVLGDVEKTKAGLAAFLFGEDQGRYLVTTTDPEGKELFALAEQHSVSVWYLGFIGGDTISIGDMPGTSGNFGEVSLADLRAAHEGFFPKLMGADAALA